MQSAAPSGLFPSRRHRPTFREPHPVRVPVVVAGAALTLAWQVLLALFATSMRGLLGLLLIAVVVASVAAGLLLRFGDRGAAVGVSLAAALGGSLAGAIVAVRWLTLGWPL